MLGCFQRFAARWRGPVHPAKPAVDQTARRSEQSLLFQSIEQGIKGAGAQSITMSGKLLNHAQAKNGFITCMMKNMQADKPRKQFTFVV